MRLGVANSIFGSTVLEEDFRLAGPAGAEGMEVCYRAPYGAKVLAEDGHARQLKEWSAKYNVAIPSIALAFLADAPSLIGPAKIVELSRQQIIHAMDSAAHAGVKVVQIPFSGRNSIELEDDLNRSADALAPLTQEAEDRQVTLALEAPIHVSRMQFLLNFLGDSDFVKAYVDVGAQKARKFDPATAIRQLGKSVAGAHFRDVKLSESAPPDFNVPLGDGSVDLGACVQALQAVGYDGWIILQTPPGDNPVAAAKASIAYMRNMMKTAG